MVLSRCGLNVLVLSRDHLPDCSVYCGSKNQYTVAICFKKWLIGLLPLSVTPKSLNCVKANACTKWGIKLWADWSRARAVEVDPSLSRKPNNTIAPNACARLLSLMDGSGIPSYGKQPVGKIANYSTNVQEAGIEGRKTGHSGKVTCAKRLANKRNVQDIARSA